MGRITFPVTDWAVRPHGRAPNSRAYLLTRRLSAAQATRKTAKAARTATSECCGSNSSQARRVRRLRPNAHNANTPGNHRGPSSTERLPQRSHQNRNKVRCASGSLTCAIDAYVWWLQEGQRNQINGHLWNPAGAFILRGQASLSSDRG